MSTHGTEITQERLRSLLNYDEETGKFTWKVNRPCRNGYVYVGDETGCVSLSSTTGKKYLRIGIDGKYYPAHRLAHLYMTGDYHLGEGQELYHLDEDRLNNKWSNLAVREYESYIPSKDRGKVFIYGLVDPETKEVRYVGKANKPRFRLWEHLRPSDLEVGTAKSLWLKSLIDKGLKPELKILDEVTGKDWEEIERQWINKFPNLVNSIDGTKNVRSRKEERGKFSQEYLKSILRYDPETGDFTWLVERRSYAGKVSPGVKAGQIKTGREGGYVLIGIDGVIYRAHILAWFYQTGKWPAKGMDIDHKNQNRADNRWDNLKEKTRGQNNHNTKVRSDNKSGCKGVSWSKSMHKWLARITVDKKIISEYFDKVEDAILRRKELEEKIFNGELICYPRGVVNAIDCK